MNLGISFIIAWQYFKTRKGEKHISVIAFLSLLGIAIGVASLIIVMAIMNGFHSELTKAMIGLNSDINIIAREGDIKDFDLVKQKLEKLEFVQHVTPLIVGQALATSSHSSVGVMIKSLDIEDIEHKNTITKNIKEGSFEDYQGDNAIAMGSYLARELKLHVGDKVRLISPKAISTIFGSFPRMREFTLVAIFTSGIYEYDSINILMPIEAGKKYIQSDVNYIELYSDNPDQAYEYSRIIKRNIGNSYIIRNWKMSFEQYLNAFKLEKIAMFTILSMIICVASFNIFSSLIMLVKDKNRDIAILKTMGASEFQILMIFIFNGAIIGGLGTILGVLLGVGFTLNIESIKSFLEHMTGVTIFDAAIYFLENLPAKLLPENIITVAVLSFSLSIIATIYPARKAAKLSPIEILRYE